MGRLSTQHIRRLRGPLLLGTLLAAVVTVPLLIPGSPDPVRAKRYGYKKYNYAAKIGRCKSGCGGTGAAIRACIARDVKLAAKNCKATYAADKGACGGDATCKRDARSRFRLCVKSAGSQGKYERKRLTGREHGGGYCNHCCQRTRGELPTCLDGFSSSPFYGSRRYKGSLHCAGGDGGGGDTGSCESSCNRAAAAGRKRCGQGKKADPDCLAQVDLELRACLSRCQGGSPSGAFMPGLTDAIRSRLARMVPWLVNGWSASERP
jgi:hypothetical protein